MHGLGDANLASHVRVMRTENNIGPYDRSSLRFKRWRNRNLIPHTKYEPWKENPQPDALVKARTLVCRRHHGDGN